MNWGILAWLPLPLLLLGIGLSSVVKSRAAVIWPFARAGWMFRNPEILDKLEPTKYAIVITRISGFVFIGLSIFFLYLCMLVLLKGPSS